MPVESSGIGIESIRKIVALYGGEVEVLKEKEIFSIQVNLMEIKK